MSKEDGGPAFARPGSNYENEKGERIGAYGYPGMSLRDYFAAKVLQATLASTDSFRNVSGAKAITIDDYCVLAYAYADGMLEARKK